MAAVVNAGAVYGLITACGSTRGALAVVSDSNGRFGSYGIQNGLITALRDRFNQYATGVIPADTQTATGWGAGAGESFYRNNPPAYDYTGANAALDTYMSPLVTDLPDRYVYYNGAATSYVATQHGYILLSTQHNFYRYQKTNRYHFTYGTFPSGTNSIRPSLARSATVLAKATAINTNTGAYGVADASFDYDNQTYTGPTDGTQSLVFHIGDLDANLNPGTFILYRMIEAPELTTGFQNTLFLSFGGKSARAMAIACNTADPVSTGGGYTHKVEMSATQFVEKVRQCVRLQTGTKRLVVVINSGLNDRNEDQASVGPLAVADGDSPEAYIDNVDQIVRKFRAAWVTLGNTTSNLGFIVLTSHALNPDDAELITYRTAAAAYAATNSDVCAVDQAQLISSTQMTANSYYYDDGLGDNQSHLSTAGYNATMRAMVQAILDAGGGGGGTGAGTGGFRTRPGRTRGVR